MNVERRQAATYPQTKPNDLGCVQAARVYIHHRHLLLLLSQKADTHFTVWSGHTLKGLSIGLGLIALALASKVHAMALRFWPWAHHWSLNGTELLIGSFYTLYSNSEVPPNEIILLLDTYETEHRAQQYFVALSVRKSFCEITTPKLLYDIVVLLLNCILPVSYEYSSTR